jgi:hypothetical protein
MEIKPPYGYEEIVPLTKQHRVTLPDGRRLPPPFRTLNALPLSFAEFTVACRDYAIAFVGPDAGNVIAMAVLGLDHGQNLFAVNGDAWDPAVYVPAYVRRYPFCMTRVTVDGKEQAERVACVEKRALSDAGEALFDGKGEPLPAWEERRKLLFDYESDLVRSEEMCRELGKLQLLETFGVQAVPSQGRPVQMSGMYRVAEQKLAELPADKLKDLAQRGILPRIYAHLISLANFGKLLDRRAGLARAS